MRTILKSILFCGAVVFAESCAKESSESFAVKGYPFTLNVTSTKTTLDGGKTVLWAADDQVGIICKNSEGTFQTVGNSTTGPFVIENSASYEPSTCATFTGELSDPGYIPSYVVYPYSASAKRHDTVENIILMEIKNTQTGVKGGFPVGTPMVGEIVDGSASLKNVGALLKINLTRTDVKSVKFFSNEDLGKITHLAGTIYVNAKTGEIDRFKSNLGDDFVKLVPPGDVFEPGTYWFCCASERIYTDTEGNPAKGILKGGFTVEIETAAGIITRVYDKPFEIGSNSIINLGSDEDAPVPFSETVFNWTLNDDKKWPFSTPEWDFRGARAARVNEDQDLTYTTADGYSGIIHTVAVSVSSAYSLPFCGTAYGFVFGGFAGDYLTLPVVEGKALKKVTMVQGHKGGKTVINLGSLESGSFAPCTGCSNAQLATAGDSWEWNPTGTSAGKQYVMYVVSNAANSSNYFSATNLVLVYR